MNARKKRYLKAQAHGLKPVVQIGKLGLTEPVIDEIRTALVVHELLKIHIAPVLKSQVPHILQQVEEETGAYIISHTGHVVVLFLQKKKNSRFDFGALCD